jgi:hypothetical protein
VPQQTAPPHTPIANCHGIKFRLWFLTQTKEVVDKMTLYNIPKEAEIQQCAISGKVMVTVFGMKMVLFLLTSHLGGE